MAKKKKKFFKKIEKTELDVEQSSKTQTINQNEVNNQPQKKSWKIGSVLISIKYIYLTVFFALLAGFFHPLISDISFDMVIIGTAILFVGLAGAILVYKAATSEKRRGIFLSVGFGLLAVSIWYIHDISGRSLL